MPATATRNSLKVIIHAEHRNGKGQLIARPTSIQAPAPPQDISFKCLWKFILDSLFDKYISSYHRRRVAYAEANRPEKKVIPERYRTGEPSPTSIIGAIIENIKLLFRR